MIHLQQIEIQTQKPHGKPQKPCHKQLA
jgi:hypothetical protein